jgi:hypothetical protein
LICRGVCFIIVRHRVLRQKAAEQSQEEYPVVKVNQEELATTITKLKDKAKAAKEKAGGKGSDPAARKAKKNVKRAQRKLRSAKAYKSKGENAKKAGGEAPATA